MKRVLFSLAIAVLFMLLPALVTNESRNSHPGSAAFAGVVHPSGRSCQCGEPGCTCFPGEEPCTGCPGQGLTVQSSQDESAPLEVDTGSVLTLVVAAAFLVLRLRQI